MSLESEHKRWEKKTLTPASKRFPERKGQFFTASGIPLPPVLTPIDSKGNYLEQSRFSGGIPIYPRGTTFDVSRQIMDDAPVCGVCLGS